MKRARPVVPPNYIYPSTFAAQRDLVINDPTGSVEVVL